MVAVMQKTSPHYADSDASVGPLARQRLSFASETRRLTHYVFRFPAKFHPPALNALISRFSSPGDTILDPFCGSGTLLVQARVSGRHSIGTDVDPLAVLISKVKSHRYSIRHLRASCNRVLSRLNCYERSKEELDFLRFTDIGEVEYERLLRTESLWVPSIPNLHHWFRRYVQVDLARIVRAVHQLNASRTHCDFLRACLAGIIRNSSNADPVPVSGLEVTAHMRRLEEKGRVVDPLRLFRRSVEASLFAAEDFANSTSREIRAGARAANARELSRKVKGRVDLILTSPPYNAAVDYYRRHQLEMFWLGLTYTQDARLHLLQEYLGRPKVPLRDPLVLRQWEMPGIVAEWENRISATDPERGRSFRHYVTGMNDFFVAASAVLPAGRKIVMVVGESQWNGETIPTPELFDALAERRFRLLETFYYPVKNRYMSYSRRNGADIREEHVLVFQRRSV
jgi:hypothetical protein